jgi:hypothetical protein
LGFALLDKRHPPVEDSILAKIFSKRKPELSEESSFGSAIEKKLANPGLDIFSCFNCFLDVLFPAVFEAGNKINARLLCELQPTPGEPAWLLYGKIII